MFRAGSRCLSSPFYRCCRPGESRGPYSRGRCLSAPAFAGATSEGSRAALLRSDPVGDLAADGGARALDAHERAHVELAGIPVLVLRDVLVAAPALEGVPLIVGHTADAVEALRLDAAELRVVPALHAGLRLDPAHPVPEALDHRFRQVRDVGGRPGDFDLDGRARVGLDAAAAVLERAGRHGDRKMLVEIDAGRLHHHREVRRVVVLVVDGLRGRVPRVLRGVDDAPERPAGVAAAVLPLELELRRFRPPGLHHDLQQTDDAFPGRDWQPRPALPVTGVTNAWKWRELVRDPPAGQQRWRLVARGSR